MKRFKYLFLLPLLILASCNTKQGNLSGSGTNLSGNNSSGNGLSAPDYIEDDDCPIQSISLSPSEVTVQVGKRSSSITVDYLPTDLDLDTKQGVWTIGDTSIATIDEYGRVTGVSKGTTMATFTTNIGKRRANCRVYVINSGETVHKEWKKVNDVNSIKAKDEIVFGCPEKGYTASNTRKDGYLEFDTSTFSADKSKITNLGSNTAQFYVWDGNDGGLAIMIGEGKTAQYLCAKRLKDVAWLDNPDRGPTDWCFEHTSWEDGSSEGDYVYSIYDSIDGWLMFNTNANRFTLYESSVQIDMFLPTIYRLEISIN